MKSYSSHVGEIFPTDINVYLIVRKSNKSHKTLSILPFVFATYWAAYRHMENYGLSFDYFGIYSTNILFK